MIRFGSLVGMPLRVLQPSIWKREYEVRNEDERIGTLRFPNIFSREAIAECDEGRWLLREQGFWRQVIVVRLPDKEKPIATMEVSHFALTNKLKLPQYRMLRLTRNLLRTSYRLANTMNAEVCSLKIHMFPKHKGEIIIDRKGEEYQELPWLVFLIWFVSIIDQRRGSK